jgi:hypothetical protein
MLPWRKLLTITLLAVLTPACGHALRFHRKPTSGRAAKAKHGRHTLHGQQAIDADRSRQIQTALIREHYLDGEPNGVWDDRSKQAMLKYQADNGWQTKVTPDSRALIKLGLGPSQGSGEGAPVATASAPRPATATGNSTPVPPTSQSHTLGSAISAQSKTQNFVMAQ